MLPVTDNLLIATAAIASICLSVWITPRLGPRDRDASVLSGAVLVLIESAMFGLLIGIGHAVTSAREFDLSQLGSIMALPIISPFIAAMNAPLDLFVQWLR